MLAANRFEILQPGSVFGLLGTDRTDIGKILDKFSVIGSVDDIENVLSKYRISQLVIATEVNLDWVTNLCSHNTHLEITEFECRIRSLRPPTVVGVAAGN